MSKFTSLGLAVAASVAFATTAASAATVGIDDHFWGESVGLAANPSTGNVADYQGVVDSSVVQNWLDGGDNFGLAFIAPEPTYYGNGQMPIVQDNNAADGASLTFTTAESGEVTVTKDLALWIKQDDPDFSDSTSWNVTPENGAPRPVLYYFDVSAYAGETLVTGSTADIRVMANWSENNKVWDIYEPGAAWDGSSTYATLVTPIPEPASLGALALGAVGLMRRRR